MMIDAEYKALTDAVEAELPGAFRACYPRNIQPPGGYCNPRHYATLMCGSLQTILNPLHRKLPHTNGYASALMLIANKVPVYFIGEEFVESVANTNLPGDFMFDELKWPLPAQLFVLPDRFVRAYYGVYAPFLAVSRCTAGDYPASLRLPTIEIPYYEIENTTEKVVFDFPLMLGAIGTDYNCSFPMSHGVRSFLDCPWVDTTDYESTLRTGQPGSFTNNLDAATEKDFISKAQNLAVKLLLAVAARPGLVEHGQITRPALVWKRAVRKELWSPNVIGRSYRIERRIRAVSIGPRVPPRFRFRRGHHAWQAKRFKGVEFVSVDQMPKLQDAAIIDSKSGLIDFTAAGPDLTAKFRACHERIWIEGFIFDEATENTGVSAIEK